MITLEDIDILVECLDYYAMVITQKVISDTQQKITKNPDGQNDVVQDALKYYDEKVRKEKRTVVELKMKLYQLQDKLLDGNSELTVDDLIGEK
jgi:Zn-dependent oligopeptidase